MNDRWLAIGTAVLLAVAMLAIALLGLTPRAHGAVVTHARLTKHDAATTPVASSRPLAGKKVGIDPGHNGRNWTDPAYIDRPFWNGREYEACDTTGTQTVSGYPEARFNWHVARFLAADLRSEGAKVILTRHNNHGVGPCVRRRIEMLNHAHVNVAVSIHGDGGPPSGKGFAVLAPVKDGINNKVIKPSWRFGRILAKTYRHRTQMVYATYDGHHGLKRRSDLGGANLTKVPYSLIECGNMRNRGDAARMVRRSFQKRAAAAIARAITKFLTAKHG